MVWEFVKDKLVGSVKDELVSFLRNAYSLLRDFNQEVEDIKRELISIQFFLKDADKRAESVDAADNEGARARVEELREVAFVAEDFVTEYTHQERNQPLQDGERLGICESVRGMGVWLLSLKRRYDLASQIQDIKRRLVSFHQRVARYGSTSSVQQESSTSSNEVRTAFPAREDEVVGIDSVRAALTHLLLLDLPKQLTVIAVVGEGGSGKTTLARQVYDRVCRQFGCYAWVVVSKPYNRVQLLRTLTIELFKSSGEIVPDEIGIMDVQTLIRNLQGFLQQKRFFVVFDDIWKEDFWGDVEPVFNSGNTGGRVMITTRKMQVADFCKRSSCVHTHKMKPLPQNEALKLFCRKVFKPEGRCPIELENLSVKIIERCGCLPLAILAVAGLLFTRDKTVKEWEAFHARLSFELENDPDLKNVMNILSLSYNDLPYDLKCCFLCFGMFPRYHEIRKGRLIRKWIAEGFVKEQEGKTMEEVSREYMNELINRCLVEPSFRLQPTKVKECRVHDLFHDIIVKKSKDISFSQVFRGSVEFRRQGIPRRISLINASANFLESIEAPNTHSVVVFCEDDTVNNLVPVLATNFKFLKVLDFEDAEHLHHLPEDIGNLFDLRYLSVRGTDLKILPESVSKLEYLETLDLKYSKVKELPVDTITRLRKMRTFYGGDRYSLFGIKLMGGVETLTDLQILCHVEAGENGVNLFKELLKLTQLKKLGITKLRSEHGRELCGCIEQSNLLESLCVSATTRDEIIDIDALKSPPQFLRCILLNGTLRKLPEWMGQHQSLVRLKLRNSKLKDSDFLHVLANLQSLLEFHLDWDAYIDEDLKFNAGMFPKLVMLTLRGLSRLRILRIDETSLTMLRYLAIWNCPLMNEVPSGLQYLRNLKVISFHMMPIEFRSLDFQSVQHVPQVSFSLADRRSERNTICLEFLNSNNSKTIERDNRGRYKVVKQARTS